MTTIQHFISVGLTIHSLPHMICHFAFKKVVRYHLGPTYHQLISLCLNFSSTWGDILHVQLGVTYLTLWSTNAWCGQTFRLIGNPSKSNIQNTQSFDANAICACDQHEHQKCHIGGVISWHIVRYKTRYCLHIIL